MRIHWIQHVSFEKLGNIEEWMSNNNHQLSCTKQFEGDHLPKIEDFDFLIVMGGPMGVYDTDKYNWLKDELLFIRAAIDSKKVVLGICLGSQFIAAAMGAKIYSAPIKEIGWFPIQIKSDFEHNPLSFESFTPTVFHWHGDTFDLPDNAQLIASTNEVAHQAFLMNNKVIGLQFHLEQTEDTIKEMIASCSEELLEKGLKIKTKDQIENEITYFDSNRKAMFYILDYLSKHVI